MFRTFAPSPIPGTVGPSFAPQNLPIRFNHVSGGVGGPEPRPIRGVSIAFGQAWNTEEPVWQNLQEIGARPT